MELERIIRKAEQQPSAVAQLFSSWGIDRAPTADNLIIELHQNDVAFAEDALKRLSFIEGKEEEKKPLEDEMQKKVDAIMASQVAFTRLILLAILALGFILYMKKS